MSGINRPTRIVAGTLLAVACIVGAFAGGFFTGQGTRMSDDQVAVQQRGAVNAAVARKGAEDKQKRLRIMARAEERMKKQHRKVIRRVVRKLKRSGDRKAEQSYSSGQSVGRAAGSREGFASGSAAGFASGTEEGMFRASDDLSCSDDPDVAWLPYCE